MAAAINHKVKIVSLEQDNSLFSVEQIMVGLPAKRAGMNLFAIESRTAQLREQSRVSLAPALGRKSQSERSQLFIETLAEDRDKSVQVTVQQLERFAPRWASLVPETSELRAEIAYLMSQEYRLAYEQIPNIRQALGLDTAEVQDAFQNVLHLSIEGIYVQTSSIAERLAWTQAHFTWRIEDLPPFWTAFSLTFTGTVGAGILALPIALAGIGPIAGMLIILILGLVNMITITALVEAVVRNGNMRYGTAFIGQLVEDYLGRISSIIASLSLLAIVVGLLTAYFIGFGTTLGNVLPIPSYLWVAGLFIIVLIALSRESLDMAAATAMLVALVNLAILVLITLLTLPNIKLDYLSYMRVPLLNNVPFDVTVLQLIFGVVLNAYFGHTGAVNAAKVVLARDPSGKSLLWGNLGAIFVAMLIYMLWVFAVNGAIPPDVLTATKGTVLIPLAAALGPIIAFLGVIYVTLGMGINAIFYSMAIFNQMLEWFPFLHGTSNYKTGEHEGILSRLFKNKFLRFAAGMSPVLTLVAIIEWLLISNQESFTSLLGYMGVIAIPVMSGIILLLLIVSRLKADYLPDIVLEFIGNRFVQVSVYLIFLASLLIHGLFIWQNIFAQTAAITAAIAMILIPFFVFRRGAFDGRDVLEIRVDDADDGQAIFRLVSSGVPQPVHVSCEYGDARHSHSETDIVAGVIPDFPELEHMSIQLPATPAHELKIWTHRVTSEGISESLRVHVKMDHHDYQDPIPMHEIEGTLILQIGEIGHFVELNFEH